MPVIKSTRKTVTTPHNHPASTPADGQISLAQPNSLLPVLGIALGVGLVSLLATELMHYLLVPDLGHSRERFLAEGLSALLVSCLIAKLAHVTREQNRLTAARMQVIAEMNHHTRNALTAISLSAHVTEDQHLIRVISEGIDRIDWALREILPREIPLPREQRHRLGYFQHGGNDPHDLHEND